jgi:trans-2,3-dihydro-3-hydroxyanthranilate isomerase
MRHCYVLRVFTRGDEGGNPLGVVTDVTGLDSDRMQRIAFDLGFSETVFLDWRAGGVPVASIFTPASEMPFAGHPLVGAAWVLGVLGPGVTSSVQCKVGEIPFSIEEDIVWIHAPGGQPVHRSGADLEGVEPIAQEMVEMPLHYHVAQLADPDAVHDIEEPPGSGSIYTWAWEVEGRSVKARFFAADVGVTEDPATGSAAVALAAVLRSRGMESGNLLVHQGDEIGAPSTILLRWEGDHVEVGGGVSRDEVRVLGQ